MNVCRTCLNHQELFSYKFFKNVDPALLSFCTSLQISKEDLYSKYICTVCFDLLVKFSKFKYTCIQSQNKLTSLALINKTSNTKKKYNDTSILFKALTKNIEKNKSELINYKLAKNLNYGEETLNAKIEIEESSHTDSDEDFDTLSNSGQDEHTIDQYDNSLEDDKEYVFNPNVLQINFNPIEINKSDALLACDNVVKINKSEITNYINKEENCKDNISKITKNLNDEEKNITINEIVQSISQTDNDEYITDEFNVDGNKKNDCNIINTSVSQNDIGTKFNQVKKNKAGALKNQDKNLPNDPSECDDKRVQSKKTIKILNKKSQSHFKYHCELCIKKFNILERFEMHKLTHEGHKESYTCKICHKKYTIWDSFRQHMECVHSEGPCEVCHICKKIFTNARRLKLHMETHQEPKKVCDICGKNFKKLAVLRAHKETHKPNRVRDCECDICGKMFFSIPLLKSHRKNIHLGSRRFICHICSFAFKKKQALNMHLRGHHEKNRVQCDLCDKFVIDLKVHKKIHSGEKSYQCNDCEKGFVTKKQIIDHIRVHTGERPYVCKICFYAFTQRGAMNRHMKTHHLLKRPASPLACRFRVFPTLS